MNRDYVNKVKKFQQSSSCMCVDFYDAAEDIDYIVTDNFGGRNRHDGTGCLRFGCENLIFAGTPQATGSIMDRHMGFCKAMTKWGKK